MPDNAATESMTGSELAWMPPPYAEPSSFSEHEVTVGTGPLAVSGTVSVPRGQAPSPGVVLLAGGGPFDRDETSGPNKPLKDLAWGLASRGAAVLRFDKATYAHPEAAAAPDLTMTQEYVPHAVDAVGLLRNHRSVDPERVFVLGHSMGGKVAPAVAVAEPTVAGLVIMAGDTQPMHHAAVRVVSYLATLVPDQVPPAVIETFQRQAALVDSAELTPSTPRRICRSACLRRTGSNCVTSTRSRSQPKSASRCSSSKADATTRSPSTTTWFDGGRAWLTARKPISVSTKPTITCSSPAQDHPPPPNTEFRSTSTPPSSPTSPSGWATARDEPAPPVSQRSVSSWRGISTLPTPRTNVSLALATALAVRVLPNSTPAVPRHEPTRASYSQGVPLGRYSGDLEPLLIRADAQWPRSVRPPPQMITDIKPHAQSAFRSKKPLSYRSWNVRIEQGSWSGDLPRSRA